MRKTGILEKLLRDFNAHRVRTDILIVGITATIPKKTGQRILAAHCQRLAQDINGLFEFVLSHVTQISDFWNKAIGLLVRSAHIQALPTGNGNI